MSPHQLTECRKTQVLKSIMITSKEVQSTFPDIPYFPSIGNNDLAVDYVMPGENSTWYSEILNIWQDTILCKHCNMKYQTTTLHELRKTFLYGGYYSVSIAGLSLLVFGSICF
jgi:hypothetical protein